MTEFSRLTADGAGALEDWGPMPADDLIAGEGLQHGRLWLDDAATGLMCGVWHCTPMTGAMGPWSTNEVMIIIDGAVTIDHADGSQLEIKAGDAFFIPKGTVCSWRQEVPLKKFFVIHDDRSGRVAENPDALRARKIDPACELSAAVGPNPDLISGPMPACRDSIAFTDLTDQLSAGIWWATPYRRNAVPSPHFEMMHILEGSVSLDDGSGRRETFVAGDTCFAPKGAIVGWESDVPVRKVFAIFSPQG